MKCQLVCFFLIVFLPCCRKSHPSVLEMPGPVIQLDNYPLKVGYKWVYDNGDTLTVVTDTVIEGKHAIKMLKANYSATEISYYANQPDGLYQVGTNSTYRGIDCSLGITINDSVNFPKLPALLAKFPADTAISWDSKDPTTQFGERRWMGYVTVTTPAGKFNCVTLAGPHGIEYYSTKGLVMVSDQMECIVSPCPAFYTKLVYVNF